MADPRFFDRLGPFTLRALAEIGEAEIAAGADPDRELIDVATLDAAGADELSFLNNPKYLSAFESTRAGACVIAPKHEDRAPKGIALLISKTPYRAYGIIAHAFYSDEIDASPSGAADLIDPTATIGTNCEIGPGVSIGPSAKIGDNTSIGTNTVIGRGVQIGQRGRVHANVTVTHCLIGSDCVVHTGARLGQDGFGFAPGANGHTKIPQLGILRIGDDVDIGANTTIDRGSSTDTMIGDGCRIDNLVQIGHNVVLGQGCIIAGMSGISGSTHLGDFVMVGGQVGIAGHLRIGDGARVAGGAGVMTDIAAGASYGGLPAVPVRDWHRQSVTLRRMIKNKGTSDE
jgi:UDP-3-O-[3-hydroxymyristoyl] glucosamine N-acyltransferase